MSQINLRLPEDDYSLLELIAKRQNIPITTLFRTIINESFDNWKIESLCKLYSQGGIRFKEAAKISGLSLTEFLIALAKAGLDPPHTEEMELASANIVNSLTKEQLFKNPNFKRKTREKSME